MKSVDEQIAIAREAQRKVDNYTQEQINEVCMAIGWEVYNDENIAQLAKLAVEETGYGRVEDKIAKHKNKILGVLRDTLCLIWKILKSNTWWSCSAASQRPMTLAPTAMHRQDCEYGAGRLLKSVMLNY